VSRLTKQIKRKGKGLSGDRPPAVIPSSPRTGDPGGVVIDDAVYPLPGEPPVAQSRGWGDMSWLDWRR
jgi:hypothetical protein